MLDMTTIAFTIIGPDRPGIVAEISDIVARHQGNWMESHMANLAGQFAGIVQVQVEPANKEPLSEALLTLVEQGLQVAIAEPTQATVGTGQYLDIEILGRDHPGIILDITQALAAINVTISAMETECFSGSMSGGDMFKGQLTVDVPKDMVFESLEETLHQVSNDLLVDLLIEEPRN